MKTILLTTTLAALAALAFAAPASAQRGNGAPWCVQETGKGMHSSAPDCRFRSREQCEETARGIGYCMQNPAYEGRRR